MTRRNPPGATRPWRLVATRELQVKLTDKTFLIGTASMLVIIALALGVQVFQSSRTQSFDLAATPDAVPMARAVAKAAPGLEDKVKVSVLKARDDDAARRLLSEDKADGWLHPGSGGWSLTSQKETDSKLESVTEQTVAQSVLAANAAKANTSLSELQSGSKLSSDLVEGDAAKGRLAKGLSLAMAFLFYVAALLFGITLANSVVEEKQSRIVEIISTSIPIGQLLAGKILGNTVLALSQMLLYVVVGVAGISFTDYRSALPSMSLGLVWFLVFFLAGFVVIACMYAVAGALASRTEDVQATSTPATMLIVLAFFGAILLEGRAQVVASFVPPFSALVMPARVVAGDAHWWEPLIALVLLAATAALVVRGASRVYRRSLLQTRGRLTMRQAWTAET